MRLALLGLLAATASVSAQATNENRNRLLFLPGEKQPVFTAATTPTPTPTPAATVTNAVTPRPEKASEIIDVFFNALKVNQVDSAYDALVADTIIASRKEDVAALKEKTRQALDNYGPIGGYEVIDEETVGSTLLRRTCISFNTDMPLRWRFYFYKNGGVWRLVDLRVDDGLVQLFEDAAKTRK